MVNWFDEIKEYVGFSEADAQALQEFRPHVLTRVDAMCDHFYECILRHPRAHAALQDGAEQIQRLKGSLRDWLVTGFQGEYGADYYDQRVRIGRAHVRIDLPQQFMFTAMNVIRLDLRAVVEDIYGTDLEARRRTSDAIDRLLDMELAIMVHSYREDSEESLVRQERLATIGQVAGSIAHELRNPLGVMKSSLFLARQQLTESAGVTHHLDKIEDQLADCSRTISNLLELARQQPPRYAPVSFMAMLHEVVERIPIPAHVEVDFDVHPGARLEADVGLLQQGLGNLILNAAQAMDEGDGRIEVLVMPHGDEDVAIEVRDTGPGFDPETITHVLEPLVTSKARGTGLGLPLVRQIAQRHGGNLELENRPEGGASVRLILPVSAPGTGEG